MTRRRKLARRGASPPSEPHRMSWQLERMIPSCCEAGKALLEELLGRLAEEGWNDHERFGVHLALEEALVNAIKHGNCSDTSKEVRVACTLSNDSLWVEICDQGPGFDPEAVPDCTAPENLDRPSGRGIMLMRNFMSRVQYNAEGNRVLMIKHRQDGTTDGES